MAVYPEQGRRVMMKLKNTV